MPRAPRQNPRAQKKRIVPAGYKKFVEHMRLLEALDSVEGMTAHKRETHPIIKKEEQLREAVSVAPKYEFLQDRVIATARVFLNDARKQARKIAMGDEKKADRIAKHYVLRVVREEYAKNKKRVPRKLVEEILKL